MNTTTESRLVGVFRGFAYGTVFALEDGTKWEQTSSTKQYVHRTRPGAKILKEETGIYLEVEGADGRVEVRPLQRKRWSGPGAF